MVFSHPELLVPSVIALVLPLYPLPWHLRTSNIATLTIIFWLTVVNIVHIVNSIVWSNNADIRAKVWGDFSAAVNVASNYGLPLGHFILAKQLESLTSLRPRSALYDAKTRRRQKRWDIGIAIVGPSVGTLVHLSVMDRRFYIVESFGPLPATYWNTWAVISMAVVPIAIAAACITYTIMAVFNIYLRRQQLLSVIHSESSVSKEQFYRLMFLAIAEAGTCTLRAICNLMSFENGPQPLGDRGAPSRNYTIIESVTLDEISTSGLLNLQLQWFSCVSCSYVFFLCFASSTETKQFYMKVVRRVFPCLPESRMERVERLGSVDTGVSDRSMTSKWPPQTPTSMEGTSGFISLEEMLQTPTTEKPFRPLWSQTRPE